MSHIHLRLPLALLTGLAFAGCGTPTAPLPLGPVEYEPLESGTVMFLRPGSSWSRHAMVMRGATHQAISIKLTWGDRMTAAAIAPGGQLIAYTGVVGFGSVPERRIAIMDLSGMDRATLTESRGTSVPAWKLLGSEIVAPIVQSYNRPAGFHAHAVGISTASNGSQTVYSSSTSSRMLFPFYDEEPCPRVTSPEARIDVNGNRFAMVCDATGHDELDILTHVGTVAAVYRPEAGPHVPPRLYSPSFSPDGAEVAFLEETRNQFGVPVSLAIRVVGANGAGARTVFSSSIPAAAAYDEHRPSLCWARNGRVVVFTRFAVEGGHHVWTVTPDGGRVRQVTFGEGTHDYSVSCAV